MKRRALAFLSTILLAVTLTTSGAPPVAASAEGRWSSTSCYGEMPYNGAWLGTAGLGASYSSVFAEYDLPLQWITWNSRGQSYVQVLSAIHTAYAAAGYECGRFGLPYKEGLYQSPEISYRWTYFVKPGNCDMRYLIHVYENGPTLEGVASNYFCQ